MARTRNLIIAIIFIVSLPALIWKLVSVSNNPQQPAPTVQQIEPIGSLRFLVEFSPPKPEKRMKFILGDGFAFVPIPGSKAKVSVFDITKQPIPGKFKMYDPNTNSSLQGETKTFNLTVPKQAGLFKIEWICGSTIKHIYAAVPETYENSSSGTLGDKAIGKYPGIGSAPEEVRKHFSNYVIPKHFLRLTDKNIGIHLSPTVTIGDLVCFTGKNNLRRHIDLAPVNYYLLIKVEAAWKLFHERHPEIKAWRYISWYRTPRHNKGQRGATFSSHIFGDACDIIVDENMDWRMDDITGDGKVNRDDCSELARVFEELDQTGKFRVGGIGAYEYPGEESTGSSIHADVRGYTDRWGFTWKSGKKRPFIWYKK